ncbi:MAG: hypothetical protein J3R72DRAFT_454481 [Linnemannia gamsii]|nr:MAG: hypothetical protein J3R72DRAFT_454481 [Linnemannia gamsii]
MHDSGFNPSFRWLGRVSIVILFGTYVYSICTRNMNTSPIQSTFLRAALMLILAGLLLYAHIQIVINFVQTEMEGSKYFKNLYGDRFEATFVSGSLAFESEAYCLMISGYIILGSFLACFILAENSMSVFTALRAKSVDC